MDIIDTINLIQKYIKNNYLKHINIEDISRISSYSPWYIHRLFLKYIGLTPAEYIRKYRLSQSAIELRDTNVKVIDVAYKYCYDSVDGYQRAFLKEFNINPYEYSKNPIPICLFIPYNIEKKRSEVIMDSKSVVKNVYITLIEKPERKVIIKRGVKAKEYFAYCEEVGCDIFGILQSMKSLGNEPVCMWLPEKYRKPNTSVYVQGVEENIDYEGVIPEGFDVITLPKCKYIMFQGEKFEEENYVQAINEVKGAIERYDPYIMGYAYDAENPRIQLEPIGSRGYIELLPVKELRK